MKSLALLTLAMGVLFAAPTSAAVTVEDIVKFDADPTPEMMYYVKGLSDGARWTNAFSAMNGSTPFCEPSGWPRNIKEVTQLILEYAREQKMDLEIEAPVALGMALMAKYPCSD